MRILIADDEKNFVETVKERLSLSRSSHVIDVAYNGKEALEMLRLKTYDVVFLDQNMPELSGVELVKYIKTNNPSSKAVIVTSYPAIDEFFAKNAGADDYLMKPVKIKELEGIIDKYHRDGPEGA